MKECTKKSEGYRNSIWYKINPFSFFKIMSIDEEWSKYESELYEICCAC